MEQNEIEKLQVYRQRLADEMMNYDTKARRYLNEGDGLSAMISGAFAGLLRRQLRELDKNFHGIAAALETKKSHF